MVCDNATAAAVAIGIALLVPPFLPPAFGNQATLSARRDHAVLDMRHRVDSRAIIPLASTAPNWKPFHGPFSNPFSTPPRPLEWPRIAPYPPGQGDTDGLSWNPDDCNKGCIDNGA